MSKQERPRVGMPWSVWLGSSELAYLDLLADEWRISKQDAVRRALRKMAKQVLQEHGDGDRDHAE